MLVRTVDALASVVSSGPSGGSSALVYQSEARTVYARAGPFELPLASDGAGRTSQASGRRSYLETEQRISPLLSGKPEASAL